MSIPWCSSGTIIETRVTSWPPCIVAVEENTAAGFPARVPRDHSGPRPSMKCFSGAAMLPKRVGDPSEARAFLEVALLDVRGALRRHRWSELLDHGRDL